MGWLSIVAVMVLSGVNGGCKCSARGATGKSVGKRSVLTYPPSSLFQITVGVSVEGDLDKNVAGFSLALQHNANLPQDGQTFALPELVSLRDFSLYGHLRDTIARYGYDGLECLRKMVCQIGETPLKGGVLEEVINYVLTPSKVVSGRKDKGKKRALEENVEMKAFLESEAQGKAGKNCSLIYTSCSSSPLDFLTYLERF